MNTGTTTERKYVNKSENYEVRYAKERKKRRGYLNNRKFDMGGAMSASSAEEFFSELEYSLLPKEFSDYVENEVINDPELNTISVDDPLFIELKISINEYIGGNEQPETNETQEAINLLQELAMMQEGAEKDETLEAIELLKELL